MRFFLWFCLFACFIGFRSLSYECCLFKCAQDSSHRGCPPFPQKVGSFGHLPENCTSKGKRIRSYLAKATIFIHFLAFLPGSSRKPVQQICGWQLEWTFQWSWWVSKLACECLWGHERVEHSGTAIDRNSRWFWRWKKSDVVRLLDKIAVESSVFLEGFLKTLDQLRITTITLQSIKIY